MMHQTGNYAIVEDDNVTGTVVWDRAAAAGDDGRVSSVLKAGVCSLDV